MGHTKNIGRLTRWYEEHGLPPERRTCEDCFWYSEEYLRHFCLKWNKDTCPYSIRKCESSEFIIEIGAEDGQSRIHKISEWQAMRSYEDYVYILDFLPYSHSNDGRPIHKREPLAQVVGEKDFTFLEVSIKEGRNPSIGDRLYIGKDLEKREVAHRVKRKLRYDQLTLTAKSALPRVLEQIVKQQEERFVRFFNRAEPITPRLHMLQLLAGVNNRILTTILEKRPFTSFSDILLETGLNPVMAIRNRVLCELKHDAKYLLFVRK